MPTPFARLLHGAVTEGRRALAHVIARRMAAVNQLDIRDSGGKVKQRCRQVVRQLCGEGCGPDRLTGPLHAASMMTYSARYNFVSVENFGFLEHCEEEVRQGLVISRASGSSCSRQRFTCQPRGTST